MLKSLEIVNKKVNYYNDGVRTIHFRIEDMIEIQKDLVFFNLIIKWKNNFTFNYNIDYLDNEEIEEFKSDLLLVQNYIYHHIGYIPKCFKRNEINEE